jgi:hypothetical protein
MGENNYSSSYNPELFLPASDFYNREHTTGMLAGSIQNEYQADLNLKQVAFVQLDQNGEEKTTIFYPVHYAAGNNSYPEIGETYSLTRLEPGIYKIRFVYDGQFFAYEVPVETEKLTVFHFTVPLLKATSTKQP